MPEHFRVHDQFYPHFITSATIHWIPIFRHENYFRIVVDNLLYCIKERGLLVHGYVFMPDHFHLLSSQRERKLSLVLGQYKGYTANRLISRAREEGRQSWISAIERAGAGKDSAKLWQDGFHPEQVESQAFFEQKMQYIHENPMKAGYVREPWHWKYSSAGFYYREEDPIVPITMLDW